MINKIAENHFNTLRMASSIVIESEESNDAFNTFMSTPSFSSKQIAIESLIQQITKGNSSYSEKTGTNG